MKSFLAAKHHRSYCSRIHSGRLCLGGLGQLGVSASRRPSGNGAEAQGELVPDAATGTLGIHVAAEGKPAPAFALDDLSGKKVSLASYREKPC